jgi:hypothetical protein
VGSGAPKYKVASLLKGILDDWQVSTVIDIGRNSHISNSSGHPDIEGDGTFIFRLRYHGQLIRVQHRRRGHQKFVAQYNGTRRRRRTRRWLHAGAWRDTPVPLPFIVLPEKFSILTAPFARSSVQRAIRIRENVRLNIIGEAFNILNIANLTGFSGTLDAYIRPTATRNATTGVITITAPGRNPAFNFGQPTGRVSPIFGTGGPRAFQLAAREFLG